MKFPKCAILLLSALLAFVHCLHPDPHPDPNPDPNPEPRPDPDEEASWTSPIPEYKILKSHRDRNVDEFLRFLKQKGYDYRQRPISSETGEPTQVHVSMFVSSIRSVSEITMDYSLELFYREYWTDPRLAWDPTHFGNKSELSMHESYSEFLWRPDTFYPNAIKSLNPEKTSITHRSLLRLRPGGAVLYSRRLSVTAECPMDLTLFPFDEQICKLEVESYGYPSTEVHYNWTNLTPVQHGDFRLPDLVMTRLITASKNASYETGIYSRLIVCFIFNRRAGFCFLQLIIPATALVITSWVCLWIENETTFQDMIAVILTITFLTYSYNNVMPRVSYIKAMDLYLGACFIFVFLSLVKLAIVKYMRQRMRVTGDQSLVALNRNTIGLETQLDHYRASLMHMQNGHAAHVLQNCNDNVFLRLRKAHKPNNHRAVKFMHCFNITSQVIFPLAFTAFCLFYFIGYREMYKPVRSPVDSSDPELLCG